MRVVVTGSSGYIGSVVTRLLSENGLHVIAMTRTPPVRGAEHPNVTYVVGDVLSRSCLERATAGADAMVHLAGIVGATKCDADASLARVVNVDSIDRLFGAASVSGVRRLIVASSCSAYGRTGDDAIVTESTPLNPLTVYARTKSEMEEHLLSRRSGPTVTILRIATAFGMSPTMRFDLGVNKLVREFATLPEVVVEGATLWRPYVHVRDVARAIHQVLRAPEVAIAHEIFNVGNSDLNLTKLDVIDEIHKMTGVVRPISYAPTITDGRNYRVSFAKLRRQVGFVATIPLTTGIAEILRAIKGNRETRHCATRPTRGPARTVEGSA